MRVCIKRYAIKVKEEGDISISSLLKWAGYYINYSTTDHLNIYIYIYIAFIILFSLLTSIIKLY